MPKSRARASGTIKNKMWTCFNRAGSAAAVGGLLLFGAVAGTTAAAAADAAVEVGADRAKIVGISGTPATVIVGNPTFADVSVHRGRIVIHGRHFGSTNVIVLDADGKEIAAINVKVVRDGNDAVVMYMAGSRQSYRCTPNCEVDLQLGDNPKYFDELVNKQIKEKTSRASESSSLSSQN